MFELRIIYVFLTSITRSNCHPACSQCLLALHSVIDVIVHSTIFLFYSNFSPISHCMLLLQVTCTRIYCTGHLREVRYDGQ